MSDIEEFYCVNCSGKTATVFRPYAIERGGKLVVIRDVPMHECDSCGETYMTAAVMKQLDELVAQMLAGKADEAIVRYPVAA
jgi:YgiT-type zinc finger domain-containing protein